MAVSVSSGPTFLVGSGTRLFEHPSLRWLTLLYDVSPNGQRFILHEPVGEEGPEPSIRVAQNWFAEFRDREQD